MKKITLILFALLYVMHSNAQQQQVSAIEGKDGLYLFYSEEFIGAKNSKGITAVVVYRSDNNSDWKEIGRQTAIYDINVLRQKFGNDFTKLTSDYLKLKSEDMLIDFFKQHSSITDYGLLAFDMYFMQAAGVVYVDINKPVAGTKLRYKIKYQKADGSYIAEEPIAEITVGIPLRYNRLKVAARKEQDSSVTVIWKGKINVDNPFNLANVYRQSGGTGAYSFAGKVMPYTEGDSVVYTFSEQVPSGGLYRYYIAATNMVGLEANPSDTASVIAANFDKVQAFQNFAFKDTMGGVLFSWTPLSPNSVYSGIAVQRKPVSESKFVTLDTIPITSSYYIDSRLIANVAYQYQFRLVNLRWKLLPPSANATVVHRTANKNKLIPMLLAAKPLKQGIKLTWVKIKHYDVNGYYVYRADNGSEYKLVSGLVKDTTFIDQDANDGRSLYSYKITSLNFSDLQSEMSNAVQAKSINKTIPVAPKGIVTTTEPGKVNLQWNNTKQADNFIVGYWVYRADGIVPFNKVFDADNLAQARFQRLNQQLLETPVFSDRKAESSKAYTYTVTSVDLNGAESNAEQFAEVNTAAVRIGAPNYFGLSKSATGVLISWDAELNKSVTDYVIYRRARTDASSQVIATVKASQLSYTDTKALSGAFYFYSIKAKSANGSESERTAEKGIVR